MENKLPFKLKNKSKSILEKFKGLRKIRGFTVFDNLL